MKTLYQRMLLEKNERVITVVRKHWFVLFAHTFLPFMLMFLPFLVAGLVGTDSMLSQYENSEAVWLFISVLWVLFMWIILFRAWTNYYLDIWTITNLRIIAIDQRSLFRRNIASFRYERLQDINIEIDGIIQTFLDFGRLEVQTAGHGESEFIFPGAPRPRETKAVILEAADARVRSQYDPRVPNQDGV